MLTSFFGKSIPLNYLLLGIFIAAAYILGTITGLSSINTSILFVIHGVFIILSVLSMLLLDFVIRKNQLTKNNSFAIFFFTCFMAMLPIIFKAHTILLANLFLLLALRRIMSLRSDTNSSKKILDASVWITVASLFHFWSLLFFIPLWIAIVQKPNSNYKQMLIPITGFLVVFLINTASQLLIYNSFEWFFNWKQPISFDFSKYNSASILVPITVILGFYIWTGVYRISKMTSIPSKHKSNHFLLFYVSIISFFVALLEPEKTGAEILFILAPVAIIAANYIENFGMKRYVKKDVTEFWFKEIMLWLVLLLPFVFLFL